MSPRTITYRILGRSNYVDLILFSIMSILFLIAAARFGDAPEMANVATKIGIYIAIILLGIRICREIVARNRMITENV